MRSYDLESIKQEKKAFEYVNLYDKMPKEARHFVFYRVHTFENKGTSRRETRDYMESRMRLLPSGDRPLTKEDMDRAFNKPSGG